jgi:hypothetical protein
MILIVLAALCLLSIPARGRDLRRLADLRLHGLPLPVLALALQVAITTIAPGGSHALHTTIHLVTYGLIATFLWLNRRLPGLPVITLGAGANALAIVLNGGVMPASAAAQRMAGLRLGPGFHNSVALAHPVLPWLGDIIPWPGPLPNVLSVGDLLVYAGTLVLLHRACASPALVVDQDASCAARPSAGPDASPAPAAARPAAAA